ncbi:MAG: WG repeat-containing protein [Chloroflexia bacterium]|nr:WG repeat-containing protein [Chloroflexia bacterium]
MKILTSLLLFLSSINILAQENNNQDLIPFLKNEKYGFANERGEVIIKTKYEWALPFYENYELTSVIKKGKPTIINRNGKEVYKGCSDFFRNDTISEMRIIPHQEIERIAIKTFCQTDSCPEFAIIEAFDEKDLFDKMNALYFVSNGEKVVLIDETGKVQSQEYDRIRHYDYGEIEFCITEDQFNQKYGLLDENGKILLECVYDAVSYNGKGVFSIKQGTIERDFKVKTKEYTPSGV